MQPKVTCVIKSYSIRVSVLIQGELFRKYDLPSSRPEVKD